MICDTCEQPLREGDITEAVARIKNCNTCYKEMNEIQPPYSCKLIINYTLKKIIKK